MIWASMAVGRRTARRQAVFALYRLDLLKASPEAALAGSMDGEADEYATDLLMGTIQHLETVDGLLDRHLEGWTLQRLGVLERSVLRVSAYELLFEKGTPEAVIIDEAVTLAKRYCSAEASALVNGVLGSIEAYTRGLEPGRRSQEEEQP
ncbi:MAG: transcription antitermination factor NusB [Actinobacteria bacterium]|nr:transcription antitermination factor NusB [Actinomycetota bacterium]